jgi:ubiquinone/menaquinone biosynthesis C-methylase UbiE
MLPRILETEAMDTKVEALDYDSMDHSTVNRAFVDDLLASLKQPSSTAPTTTHLEILDVGTGTAQIPIELCRRPLNCQILAVDLANEMLNVAARNISVAGFNNRIRTERVDAKGLPFLDASFDVVISNSIVHHIPTPKSALAEMWRVVRAGGLFFVRDLLRPNDVDEVERIVATYAGNENSHSQQMFRDSLHAALTLDEMRELLDALRIPPSWVVQTSDRHWTVSGRKS